MKRLDDFNLHDEFSVRGKFWLPQDTEDQIPGELRFSGSGIRLHLDGSFKSMTEPSAYERLAGGTTFAAPVILGITGVGELMTLKRTFASRLGNEVEFVANELFVGIHFINPDDDQVEAALVEFTHLAEWVCFRPYELKYNKADGRSELSFSSESAELLRIDAVPPFKKLTISAGVRSQLTLTGANLTAGTRVIAEFEAARSTAEARQALDVLNGLFSLLVGEAVYPKKIRVIIQKGLEKIPVEIFLPLREHHIRIEHGFDMIFPLSEIKGEILGLISQWISEEKKFRAIYNLLLSTVQAPDQYVQSTFLSLMQALESYHRIAYGGRYLDEDTYGTVKSTLITAIPAGTSPDLVNKLKNILEHGNEFSLRKRLRMLFNILGASLTDKFLGNEKVPDFIGKIVDIRNYLTHHDDSSLPGVAFMANDVVAMYNLNQRLRALTTVLIFIHLGMSEQSVAKLFSVRRLRLADRTGAAR